MTNLEQNSDQLNKALASLNRLSTEEALAVLEALEKKRRDSGYVRYWHPNTDGQREALAKFSSGIKVMLVRGGNRSGKSEIGGAISAAWALGKDYFKGEPAWEWVKDLPIPEPPNNIWIVGLDFPTLRDVLWREKMRMGKTHPAFLPHDETIVLKTNDSDYQAFFANGSIITGKSADSGREKFQGASVDLVWIDEEPDVDIFDECYQRTVDCAGKILVTLTPLRDISSGVRTPWVFDLVEDMNAGQKDIACVSLSVLDNPVVPPEEKKKLLEKWQGHPEERARLYGEFIQRSGLVYNLWDPKKHIVAPFHIPRDWRRIVSIDPAATGPTGAVWTAIDHEGNMYVYREYLQSNLIASDHAKNIQVRNGGDPIDIWLIDPKWGSQRNPESHKTGMQLFREHGIPVRLANIDADYGVNASREYLAATVNGGRNGKLFVFDSCKDFRWQIEHYTWDFFQQGEMKGMSKDKPRKGNDDLINAWQYICAMRPGMRARQYRTTSEPGSGNSYT